MEISIEEFLEYIRNRGKFSENTIMSYSRDLKFFKNYLREQNINKVENITTTVLSSYLIYMKNNDKAQSTILRNISTIRGYFDYMFRSGKIKVDPSMDIELPKQEKKPPEILSQEQINKLLDMPDTSKVKGVRDKAMMELLYATGIKVSEIMEVKLDDINLDLSFVKCGNASTPRIIPFGSKANKVLNNYIENFRSKIIKEENNYLFVNLNGKNMTRQGIWKIVREYGKHVTDEKDITPNMIRHSFAMHLVQNGAELDAVQEMLGHKDIAATQLYAKMVKSKVADVYRKAHPRA
ncbi:MAG: tyrosine recombinase [Clostridia bacterium]|jgi:integrase/recombinase XerD|nr:tyrosine recombinase [Clostridia bacterium]